MTWATISLKLSQVNQIESSYKALTSDQKGLLKYSKSNVVVKYEQGVDC